VLGGAPEGLEVVCANRIPHGRGLGSSAAAIVAGVVAARGVVVGGSERLDDDAVINLATSIEGHPDNVAACVRGGLTVAWTQGERAAAVGVPVSPDIAPVALVPGSSSSTRAARKLLPDSVPHADAARNAGRAALLVEALRSRPDLLMAATEDALHQPYRAEAMPRTAALMGQLRAAGIPAVVSGAGPTVLALTTAETREQAAGFAKRGWTAMPLDVDAEGAQIVAL
jgi:homoserine kinase